MAAPYGTSFDFGGTVTGNVAGYDTGTRVLDMMPGITLLDPAKTPLTAMLNSSRKLTSSTPNWLNDSLDAIGDNAIAEGADFTFGDPSVSTRTQNVCRTIEKTAKVSTVTEAESHYDGGSNNTSERSHQLKLKFMSFKRDAEWAILNSNIAYSGEGAAPKNRGLLQSMDGASHYIDASSANLSETLFKENILKLPYDDGAEVTDVFATYEQHKDIDAFTAGVGTKYIDANQREFIDYVNIYDSLLGRVQLHVLRSDYLSTTTVFGIDRQFYEWAWLIPPHAREVTPTGHYWASVITGTGTLIDRNASAGAALHTLAA